MSYTVCKRFSRLCYSYFPPGVKLNNFLSDPESFVLFSKINNFLEHTLAQLIYNRLFRVFLRWEIILPVTGLTRLVKLKSVECRMLDVSIIGAGYNESEKMLGRVVIS